MEGLFPRAWKKATFILLRKGNKPLDQPSSYRPICLINTIGKLFERVIKNWLVDHLEQTNRISHRQFGFTKGRSTIDAINSAIDIVNKAGIGPLYKRELCAMVSLDVANAFNSASWVRIEEALAKKRVPPYLIRVLRSYLSDRKLIYGEAKCRKVTTHCTMDQPKPLIDVKKYNIL